VFKTALRNCCEVVDGEHGLRIVEYCETSISVVNLHQQWTVNPYSLIVYKCSIVVTECK